MSTFRIVQRPLPEVIKHQGILHSGLDHNSKFYLGPHKIIDAPAGSILVQYMKTCQYNPTYEQNESKTKTKTKTYNHLIRC